MKHTPGPWFITGNRKDPDIRDKNGWIIVNQVASGVDNSDDSGEINARLIVVCPMMYDYIILRAETGDKYAKEIIADINKEIIQPIYELE